MNVAEAMKFLRLTGIIVHDSYLMLGKTVWLCCGAGAGTHRDLRSSFADAFPLCRPWQE